MHEEVIPAQERGSCTRKHPPTRQAVAQKEQPLETGCCSRGCHEQGYTARRGCCRRRGRRLLHKEGPLHKRCPWAQAMHKRLSAPWVEVSLGAGEVLHLDGAGADSEADVLVML